MIVSVRHFLNDQTISDSIKLVQNEQDQLLQKLRYEKNFVIPHKSSNVAEYFYAHENNTLFENEYIVKFTNKTAAESGTIIHTSNSASHSSQNNFSQRKQFINSKSPLGS